jgi:hypothetical protein
MRKRLEDLSERTQPHPLNHGNHEEGVEVFDSRPGEVVSTPMSSKAQKRKKIA